MLTLIAILTFASGLLIVMGIQYNDIFARRPTLKIHGLESPIKKPPPAKFTLMTIVRRFAGINKPLVTPAMRQEMAKNAILGVSVEEMLFIKEMSVVTALFLFPPFFGEKMALFSYVMAFAGGWVIPDIIFRGKIKKIKEQIVRQLPDTVDLLGLCVNAGLDFMMALKWVVEKSPPTVFVSELNNVLQEINVGKPRREALRDLAKRYELPDLSTFSRTLIQADKMGTSVSEALNILSEDMRLARYRRGEAMALQAPLKMLAPLLFCIFPVVGILVGAPIFLDFMYNNPLKHMAGG